MQLLVCYIFMNFMLVNLVNRVCIGAIYAGDICWLGIYTCVCMNVAFEMDELYVFLYLSL